MFSPRKILNSEQFQLFGLEMMSMPFMGYQGDNEDINKSTTATDGRKNMRMPGSFPSPQRGMEAVPSSVVMTAPLPSPVRGNEVRATEAVTSAEPGTHGRQYRVHGGVSGSSLHHAALPRPQFAVAKNKVVPKYINKRPAVGKKKTSSALKHGKQDQGKKGAPGSAAVTHSKSSKPSFNQVDRSNFKDKSQRAMKRETEAVALFKQVKKDVEAFVGSRTAQEYGSKEVRRLILEPACHLTDACWKSFRRFVRSHPGWIARRREATAEQKATFAAVKYLKGKVYYIDGLYTIPKSRSPETVTTASAPRKPLVDASNRGIPVSSPGKMFKPKLVAPPAVVAMPTTDTTVGEDDREFKSLRLSETQQPVAHRMPPVSPAMPPPPPMSHSHCNAPMLMESPIKGSLVGIEPPSPIQGHGVPPIRSTTFCSPPKNHHLAMGRTNLIPRSPINAADLRLFADHFAPFGRQGSLSPSLFGSSFGRSPAPHFEDGLIPAPREDMFLSPLRPRPAL